MGGATKYAIILYWSSLGAQSLTKPALKHVRTELQSVSESRPIKRTSRCNSVTGNNLKYDG